jgi:spore coat polysaccharide biosynthesis protein SpsF
MTTVAIIQARMTSTRLPGKVLADLAGRPMLAFMLARVRRARSVDVVWVATTDNATDDPVVELCGELDIPVFRGNEQDVLGRFSGAAHAADADIVVRLTGDCPLIDPALIDQAIAMLRDGGYDYLSNAIHATYPDGLDVEVFTAETLYVAERDAPDAFHREHVTPYMRTGVYPDIASGDFKVGHMTAPADFSHLRWTVDTQDDLDRLRDLVAGLPADFSWHDVLALLTREPDRRARPSIQLRAAACSDSARLFDWVNRADSLANKLATRGPIARADHDTWFAARLSDPDCAIWVAELDGTPVGQTRLERSGDGLEVDIYVDPDARGGGAAHAMLDAVRDEAAVRWPGVDLLARVKPDNWPSRRLFARAGYGRVTVMPDHLVFHRSSASDTGNELS